MASRVLPFSQIPGPKGWPLIGTLLDYKFGPYKPGKYHESLPDIQKRYGNIVKQKLGNRQVVYLFDPNDVEKVYAVEGKTPSIVPLQPTVQYYRELRKLSPGLGNINGEEWYRLRRGIQRIILLPQNVRKYLPVVDAGAADLARQIQERRDETKEVKDLFMLISKWNLEMAAKIFLGFSIGCMDGGTKEKNAERAISKNIEVFSLSAELNFTLPFYKYITTPKWKRLIQAEDYFMSYISEFIKEAIDRAAKLKSAGKLVEEKYPFLAHLFSQPELNREDIFILAFSMVIDGLSTTVPALVSNLYCLSSNPEAQKKLHEEIQRELPPSKEFTTEMLDRMPYVLGCIRESFRLFPTGTEVSRILPKDLIVGNYLIPAGTAVDLCQFVHSRSEEIFPEPNAYKPERWLKSNESIHPYLRTHFSHGIRTCAGRRFAQQDLILLISRLVQKFRLEYNDSEPMKQVYKILLFPDRSPRIKFSDRK